MSDEGYTDVPDNEAPRRRSTYTPPSEEADVPLNLGETGQDQTTPAAPSPNSVAPVTPPPLVTPPATPPAASPLSPPAASSASGPAKDYLSPPVRRSLSDQDIMAQMGEPGSDTAELIGAFQEQMDLRKREDEEFDSWEALIRQSYPEDEAEGILRQGRADFEGVDISELPPPVASAAAAPAPEPEPGLDVSESLTEEAPQSEPIVLPTLGRAPEESPVEETEPVSDGSFEAVLHDEQAQSPPTNAWPLAEPTPDQESEVVVEVEQSYMRVDEVTVTGDGMVTDVSVESHEVLSVKEVLQTKDTPEVPLADLEPEVHQAFGFDHVGAEPTPQNQRADSLLQLLWAWWAIGTPIPLLLLGTWLVSSGLNVTQALLAAAGGAVVAALPVVIATVQGSRLGLPTLVTSRAVFGMVGNIIPSILMVLIRVSVAALVMWAAAWMATGVLVESNYWNGEPALMLVLLAAVFALTASGLAVAGRSIIRVTLWVSAALALLGLIGIVLVSLPVIQSSPGAVTTGGPGAVVAGLSVVMAALILFWAHFGGDLARFQRPGTGGAGSAVSAVAAVIPVVVLLALGALAGATSPEFTQALFADPFDALLDDAPLWYPIPAIVLGALPLIGIASLALHSSGYALMSAGVQVPRYLASTIVSAVAALLAISLVVFVLDLGAVLVPMILLLGVIAAAWVGSYTGEVLTRRVYLDPRVIAGMSGDFPRFRIAPVLGFVAAIGLGWGLIQAAPAWLEWSGYLLGPLQQVGVDLVGWNAGPLVALAVALVVSLFAGIQGGVVTTDRRARTE